MPQLPVSRHYRQHRSSRLMPGYREMGLVRRPELRSKQLWKQILNDP